MDVEKGMSNVCRCGWSFDIPFSFFTQLRKSYLTNGRPLGALLFDNGADVNQIHLPAVATVGRINDHFLAIRTITGM